jgi:hypothetical protein
MTEPFTLPCPFCGFAPRFMKAGDKHKLGCTNPECTAQPFTVGSTQEQARKRWNTRA